MRVMHVTHVAYHTCVSSVLVTLVLPSSPAQKTGSLPPLDRAQTEPQQRVQSSGKLSHSTRVSPTRGVR